MATILMLHGTGGRLGNRLLLEAHLVSFCLEHPRWRLVNFNFVPYAHLFEESRHHPWMVFPPRRASHPRLIPAVTSAGTLIANAHRQLPEKWAYRISLHGTRLTHRLFGARAELLEWGDGRRQDLGAREFVEWTERFDWIVLGGFLYRHWPALEEHQQAVRHFLRPARQHVDKAEPLMTALRSRYRTVIGVLVRRTDYSHWLDGRFHFELAQYRDWLQQLACVFGPDAGLLIAGDDPAAASLLEGLPAHVATGAAGQGGHYMESVAALSMCDVVASPPSTFAAMAAFLGAVPILPLHRKGQRIGAGDLMPRHLFDAVAHPEFGRAVS